MIAVIFEVEPAEGKSERYFDIAATLRDELAKADGFISVERFQSLTNDKKYLSLSFWTDQESVQKWYTQTDHTAAQSEGRAGVFKNYRIRVADVFRDYDMATGRPADQGKSI